MKRHRNTLLELERRAEKRHVGAKRVLAKSYDSGVSIELCYDSAYWRPAGFDSNLRGPHAASLPFGLADEVAAYTVEPFESENLAAPITADDLRKKTKEEFEEKPSAPEPAATSELPEQQRGENGQAANQEERPLSAGVEPAASAFAQDLHAIAAEQKKRAQQIFPSAPTTREEAPRDHPHAIFDRIGRNMAYATTFDLGTLELQNRFNEFDRQLDASGKRPPGNKIEAFAGPVALNDLDVAEDFEAMGMASNRGKEATAKISVDPPGQNVPDKDCITPPEHSATVPLPASDAPPATPQ